jgi:predicted DNA-binding WGR domain protein
MRRFEHPGPPRKFWEIGYHDGRVERRWGTDGRPAQHHARNLDRSAARDFMAREIAAQLARGFVELAPPATTEPTPPTRPIRKRFLLRTAGGGTSVLELELDGTTLIRRLGELVAGVARWGDMATTTTFHSHRPAAKAAFDDAIVDARYQGYQPASIPVALAAERDLALERACLDAPDDAALWGVYMDSLLAAGDARGELASRFRARHADATRLLQRHWVTLCGGVDRELLELWFEHGFARRAALGLRDTTYPPHARVLTRAVHDFLAAPIAVTVDHLRLGAPHHPQTWTDIVRAVAESPRAPHLRHLALEDRVHDPAAHHGELTGLLAPLSRLEHLALLTSRRARFAPGELPRLRSFVRRSDHLDDAELAAIVSAEWPVLHHLELRLGTGGSLAALAPIFERRTAPALRELALAGRALADGLIDALASSALLPQLHALDLRHGELGAAAARQLVAHAPRFRHLAAIDLSHNPLAADDIARLRAVLDNVVVS